MKFIKQNLPQWEDAVLEGYILDCEILFGQEKTRPAIIVCPGGGYVYCSPREGEPVALKFAAEGFHTFVLRYSTGRAAAGFAPLQQISWVIGYLRENAEQWNIDPEKIVTCGFSAGGHLALSAGILAENKPNAMILGYPATSIPNIPGQNFMLRLLEGKETVTNEDARKYDLVPQITKDAPPVFMMATSEDLLTNYGALPLAQKYGQLGLGYELHVYQFGPHGMSTADVASADGSAQVVDADMAGWIRLCAGWLHRIFGKPVFVDKSTSKIAGYLKELGFIKDNPQGAEFA